MAAAGAAPLLTSVACVEAASAAGGGSCELACAPRALAAVRPRPPFPAAGAPARPARGAKSSCSAMAKLKTQWDTYARNPTPVTQKHTDKAESWPKWQWPDQLVC